MNTEGMTPIAKNVAVLDGQGNSMSPTYPKRAKGLVKQGRARYVDENTICLTACPPDNMEDANMQDNYNGTIPELGQTVSAAKLLEAAAESPKTELHMGLTLESILARMDKIMQDTEYIHQALQQLNTIGRECKIPDNMGPHFIGDIAGQSRADAVANIVQAREMTNQNMLQMLHKMYNDLTVRQHPQQDQQPLSERIESITELIQGVDWSECPETVAQAVAAAIQKAF